MISFRFSFSGYGSLIISISFLLVFEFKEYTEDMSGSYHYETRNLNATQQKPLIITSMKLSNEYTSISKIRIVNELEIRKIKPDYILILIWHFGKFIIKKIKKFSKKTKIIIPFPKIKIIN